MNYNNSLGLIHFQIHTKYDGDIKDALYQIFSRDLDFTENEEYFRKTTLKLGYENEADRLVSEYVSSHEKINTLPKVERAVKKLAKKVFDSGFYSDYQISVEQIDENIFSVAISYIY
jgi:hypothetical protein